MCGVYEKVQHSPDAAGWRRLHTQKCGQVRLTRELMNTCEPLLLLGGRDPEIVGLCFLRFSLFKRFACGIRMLHVRAACILQQR